MRRMTLFFVVAASLVIAACGGVATTTTPAATSPPTTQATATTEAPETTTTTAGTTTTEAAEAPGPQLVLSSLNLGDNGMIVVTNVGTEAGSLSGYFLCQRPNYFALPEVTLEPGQSFAISTGGSVFLPPPGAITSDELATVGTLSPTGGEMGLYSSSDFNSPSAIVSYLEWGSSGHGRSSVAVEAGIWPAGGFVPTAEDTSFVSANTLPATEPAHWQASSG
ncbi:MAG: hypothetical protein ACE5F5_06530 [Acidimicrobiia bacterium]